MPRISTATAMKKVSGVPIRLKTVSDLNLDLANQVKERYGYEQAITNFDDMLADPEIDVIDIVTPPFLHCSMAIKALKAGKHVICEKPLTGYFGKPGEENVGRTEKSKMYREVMAIMDELKEVVDSHRQEVPVRRELRLCHSGPEGR